MDKILTRSSNDERKRTLLAVRLINSLPLVNSFKGYYNYAKERNQHLKSTLDVAESTFWTVSQPILSRYEKVDEFASKQLDTLGHLYDTGTELVVGVAQTSAVKAAQVVAFPVGLAVGVVQASYDIAVQGTRIEQTIEKVIDAADIIIDNVLPPTSEETSDEKNPVTRIRNRATLWNVMQVPSNTLDLSRHIAQKYSTMTLYRTLEFSSVLVDNIYHQLDSIMRMVTGLENVNISAHSLAPILTVDNFDMVMGMMDRYQWGKSTKVQGARLVHDVLNTLFHVLDNTVNMMDKNQLPHTTHLVHAVRVHSQPLVNRLAELSGLKRTAPPFIDEDEQRELRLSNRRERLLPMFFPVGDWSAENHDGEDKRSVHKANKHKGETSHQVAMQAEQLMEAEHPMPKEKSETKRPKQRHERTEPHIQTPQINAQGVKEEVPEEKEPVSEFEWRKVDHKHSFHTMQLVHPPLPVPEELRVEDEKRAANNEFELLAQMEGSAAF